MRRSPRTRLFAASVAMFATFALAACGDDDDDDDGAVATIDTAATSDAVETSEPSATSAAETTGTSDDDTTPAGSGEVGSRDEYVAAAQAQFPVDDDELAGCISEALVTDDVYAQIEELGVSVADFGDAGPAQVGITLDEDQATAMAEEIVGCGDLVAALLDDEADRACAEENMSNEQFAQYVSFTLYNVEPSDELQAAYDAMDECMSATATTTS